MNTRLHFSITGALLVFVLSTAGLTNLSAQDSGGKPDGYYRDGIWQEGSASEIHIPYSSPAPSLAADVIDFDDDPEPCNFVSTVALREKYADQGVHFDGPGTLDGGGILDECGNFGVTGYSAPNFLAFNTGASFSNGGSPSPPETIRFDYALESVGIMVGSGSGAGSNITMTVFDEVGEVIGSISFNLTTTLAHLSYSAIGLRPIWSVEISTTAAVFVMDDLDWTVDNGCGFTLALERQRYHPGEEVTFEASVHHMKEATVTVPINAWIESSRGEIVSSTTSEPLTFEYGDFLTLDMAIPLPHDLHVGTYRLLGSIGEMKQGVVKEKKRFEVVSPHSDDIATNHLSAEGVPEPVKLGESYPNPFNPTTTIRFSLPEKGLVKLEVFDLVGQRVALLVDGEQEAGYHDVLFDAGGLPSGIYFYRLRTGNYVETKRLMLLK